MPKTKPQTKIQRNSPNLANQMERLAMGMERANSLRFSILKGVVYGLATAPGASIVAALIIGILAKFIPDIPMIGNSI